MSGTQIRFSRRSNLAYLPLVYFLPEHLIARCPTLRRLPRKVREVVNDECMMKVVNSDQYLDDTMNAAGLLAFPHFGFRGWKEDYSADFPVWKLSHAVDVWSYYLEAEIGWGLQALYNIPSYQSIPFFDSDYIKETMRRVVKRAIEEQGWQPILEVLREMPCHEDFEDRQSNARIDFYRKWYHSRTKYGVAESLESYDASGYDEDRDDGRYRHRQIKDSYTIGSEIEGEDFYNCFMARLSEEERIIVKLREEGHTYQEIAAKLGYKTHSAVVKKMKAIKEAYQEHQG